MHAHATRGVRPCSDGQLLGTCSSDGLVRLWDFATGHLLRTLLDTTSPPVATMQFSPNNQYLLASCLDQAAPVIKIWDWRDSGGERQGRVVRQLRGHRNSAYFVPAMFVHGTGLLSASEDGAVCVWDINSRKVRRWHPWVAWHQLDFRRTRWLARGGRATRGRLPVHLARTCIPACAYDEHGRWSAEVTTARVLAAGCRRCRPRHSDGMQGQAMPVAVQMQRHPLALSPAAGKDAAPGAASEAAQAQAPDKGGASAGENGGDEANGDLATEHANPDAINALDVHEASGMMAYTHIGSAGHTISISLVPPKTA